jgi:hypothetical protein
MVDFSVHVTDDDGLPVSNATVCATYVEMLQPRRDGGYTPPHHSSIVAQTDSNGLCHIQGKCTGELVWGVKRTDCYPIENMEMVFSSVVFGRLQPWGKQYDITLRRIVNPIAMYAGAMAAKAPEVNKPFGFDLMKADMVAPYGKGEVADFIIKLESSDAKVPPGYYENFPRAIRRKNETLTITFSNPDDGIQPFYAHPRQGSTFRSPRYAPETGYVTNLVSIYRSDEGNFRNDKARVDQNYIFRVRTIRNEHGVITNAFYGKIYGAFNFHAPFATCTYYLNPTSLDRNLEFDRTKNLLQGVVDQRQLPSEP